MTIVERAIEKLRRSADTQPGAATRPVGSLVVEPTPEVATEDTAEMAVPSRRILIDRDVLRREGYLPESSRDRQFADHYRRIKRPLIVNAMNAASEVVASPRLIMMASALPGDGKTFTSINLALSMARERDISVVLVDADAPKPHVSRIFGVEKERGLLDALGDAALDVESLVLPTDVKGLSILPAGSAHEGATELLASARMTHVVARLISRNPRRMVLFDSPPLLAATESRALLTSLGQVVLVVRSGATPRQAVLDALAMIGEGRQVSLVLNQGRVAFGTGYYDYYQGNYGSDAAEA